MLEIRAVVGHTRAPHAFVYFNRIHDFSILEPVPDTCSRPIPNLFVLLSKASGPCG